MIFLAPDAKTGLNEVSGIPRRWRAALEAIQLIVPDAVMAGGCLRDHENGVAVKDIDIFIPAVDSRISDADNLVTALVKEGWQDVKLLDHTIYKSGCDTRVIGVVETRYPNCPPIQLVIGEWDMENLWNHFDFGICQITFDGQKLRRSGDYRSDMLNRRFRIVTERSDEAFVASINRWARLKEKYSTWTFDLGTRRQQGYATGGVIKFPPDLLLP